MAGDMKIKSILVNYRMTGVGNMILFTPVLDNLRLNFPEAKITVLVLGNPAKDIIENWEIIDELLEFPLRPGLKAWGRLLLRLRKQRFDLAITCVASWQYSLLFFLSGITFRVGHEVAGEKISGKLMTHQIRILKDRHEAEYNLDLLRALGLSIRSKELFFGITKSDNDFAATFFQENGITENDLVVGMQPGSYLGYFRRWGEENFSTLADMLSGSLGAKIILLGSREEIELGEIIRRTATSRLIDSIGKTTLRQAGALIKKCRIVVSNDSGLMHVAVAIGVPTVGIFGPTDFVRSGQFGDGHHIIVYKDLDCRRCYRDDISFPEKCPFNIRCLKMIKPEEVFKLIEDFFKNPGSPKEKTGFAGSNFS